MAVSAGAIWEFRSTGAANMAGGGGFITGASGTNYSLQDAIQYALVNLASAGAGNVVLDATATADMVGNVAHCISGTNFTTGWFEILSVSVGVSITFGTNSAGASIVTGVGASGVINIGGALNTGSLENIFATTIQAGNQVWVKQGTYVLSASMTTNDLTGNVGIQWSGYAVSRGDNPRLATRPLFSFGGQNLYFGNGFMVEYMQFLGNTALNVQTTQGIFKFCKFTNNSTTAGRNGLTLGAGTAIGCEVVSYRGPAISANANPTIVGCYVHDSDLGLNISTASQFYVFDSLFEACGSSAIRTASATAVPCIISGCTFVGYKSQRGVGLSLTSGAFANMFLSNSIFTGFNIGVYHSSAVNVVSVCAEDSVNYFNNGTDVSGWNKDSTATALDPQFTSYGVIVGSNATTNGAVLNDTTLTLTGIIPNQDFCLVTGSSIVPGQYLITAFTANSLTLFPVVASSLAPVSYLITTGRNYGLGTNLKALAQPGNYGGSSAGISVSYKDLGAIQRQEAGGGSFTFVGG